MEPSTWRASGGSVSSRLRLHRLAVPVTPVEPQESEPCAAPTFRDLLTQVSSEYERVESALADARAQLEAVERRRPGERGPALAVAHVEPVAAGGHSLAESNALSASELPALLPLQVGRLFSVENLRTQGTWQECQKQDVYADDSSMSHSGEEAEEKAPMECKRSNSETQGASFRLVSRVSSLSQPWRRSSYRATPTSSIRRAGSRWVINPDTSAALQYWDYITMVALAFVVFVTPVQVSMLDPKLEAMLFANFIVDAIFLFDTILQFFLMYPQRTNYGWTLEHRHPNIVKHYLKSYFAIDLLSLVPFDTLAALSNAEGSQRLKIIKAVRLLRLLKLVRVLKASRIFSRFETRMSLTYRRLALLKFFVILFGITHWLANLWALTLVLVDESDGLPRWVDSLTDLEANVEVKTKDSPAKLYIACLYFTSYTITSVGYGDIGPKNILERVVLTFIIIASGISWAVVLGQVCGIVATLNQEEQAFQSTMDELNNMMHDRLIPVSMRMRLRSFFLSNKTARIRARHQELVSAMSPGLRAEVSWEINRFWLDKVTFLRPFLEEAGENHERGSLRSFVLDTSLMMEQEVRAQRESFGVPHTMYILIRGLVSGRGRLRGSGSVWGADFVLVDLHLLEPVDSYALTYAELMALGRQNFFDVVQKHSANFPEINRTVRRHCCWLAFQRALMMEAKQRRTNCRGC